VTVICGAILALALGQSAGTPHVAPQSTLQHISSLLESQKVDAARQEVLTALKTYPQDPVLHNLAGVIEAERGQPAAAESQFQTAIRLAPALTSAYENLGRLYQERSASDATAGEKALKVYATLLTVDPGNTEGLYQSAYLLAKQGRFQESAALVTRLPEDARGRPQILALTATDAAGIGNSTASAAAVRALATHPDLTAPDVLGLLPALDHLSDDNVTQQLLEALDARGLASGDALQRLGTIYLRHGRFADARAMLERASAAGAPAVPVLLDLARAADKLGDHEGALGYLAHARSLEPSNARVHFMFGMICVELDLVREAYESLKQAVTLAPDNALVNYAMGAVSMHRHEPAEALPYFENYVRLVPDDPRGRFALGVARFTAGQMDEAARDLHEAARHDQTAGGAHYYLARIARQANDLETARREIQESLDRVPDFADGWAESGLIETRAGNYDAAQKALDKAVQLDPDNYLAAVNLTTLYTRTKDPRREAQATKLAALQQKREAQAQDFLRIIQVVPE
jgi:tetratricopeptide (TPR) repeat protein